MKDVKKFVEDNLGKTVSFSQESQDLDVSSGIIVGYREDVYVIISINSKIGWNDSDQDDGDSILLKTEEDNTYWYMFPEDLEIID